MKKIIFIFCILVLSCSNAFCAGDITREILLKLEVRKPLVEGFLNNKSWQCGKLDDKYVRFAVNSDIVAVDRGGNAWYLHTPMSTKLPVTAFATRIQSGERIGSKIVILQRAECSEQKKQPVHKKRKKRVEQKKSTSKKKPPVIKEVHTKKVTHKNPQRRSVKYKVASVWEFYELTNKLMEGER